MSAHGPWRPLGVLLVEKGVISEAELETALADQAENRRPLGEILIAHGFSSRPAIQDALAEQAGVLFEPERGFGTGLRGLLARKHRQRKETDPPARPQLEVVPPLEEAEIEAPPQRVAAAGAPATDTRAPQVNLLRPVDQPQPTSKPAPSPIASAPPPATAPAKQPTASAPAPPPPAKQPTVSASPPTVSVPPPPTLPAKSATVSTTPTPVSAPPAPTPPAKQAPVSAPQPPPPPTVPAKREPVQTVSNPPLARPSIDVQLEELRTRQRRTNGELTRIGEALARVQAELGALRAAPAVAPAQSARPDPPKPKPKPDPEPVREPELPPAAAAPPVELGHLRFVLAAAVYRLETHEGPAPAVGDPVEVDERMFRVVKVARSPLPGDERRCAYLLGD